MNLNKQKFTIPHQLKLLILVALSSMLWTSSMAQEGEEYNKFSLEISGGLHIPVAPSDMVKTGDYVGLQQIQLSGRYMLNTQYGFRAFYAYNRFDADEVGTGENEGEDLYNTFNRVGIEGIVDLGDLFNMNQRFLDRNNILVHAGAGFTFSKPSTSKKGNTDHMGFLVAGITPQRKISSRVALFADVSYVINFKQHNSYSGIRFEDKDAKMGGFGNLSIGLIVYLGSEKEHGDWY